MAKELIKSMQKATTLTIEELSEELEQLKYEQGINIFKITESFPKNGKHSYLTRLIELEVERGYVITSDIDNIIQENKNALMMFFKRDISYIEKKRFDEELNGYHIQLETGYIQIQPIWD